jgi:arsenate reductase
MKPLARAALAEYLGAAFLVAVVVGSGIMATRLSPDDVGLQLLENSFATAGGLAALILAFGSVSGSHFNPVVSLVDWKLGGLTPRELAAYVPAQVAGACTGAVVANLMFELDAVDVSTKTRSGGGMWLAEVVATLGLLLVIVGSTRSNPRATPFAVGAYIGGAYFFTSSTSFANPAVTIGRTLSDTFAGIDPASVPAFVGAQLVGAVAGYALIRALFPTVDADAVVVPHHQEAS